MSLMLAGIPLKQTSVKEVIHGQPTSVHNVSICGLTTRQPLRLQGKSRAV